MPSHCVREKHLGFCSSFNTKRSAPNMTNKTHEHGMTHTTQELSWGLFQKAGLTNSEFHNEAWDEKPESWEKLFRICSINSESSTELWYYNSLWQQANKRQSPRFNPVDIDILMHIYADCGHLCLTQRAWIRARKNFKKISQFSFILCHSSMNCYFSFWNRKTQRFLHLRLNKLRVFTKPGPCS